MAEAKQRHLEAAARAVDELPLRRLRRREVMSLVAQAIADAEERGAAEWKARAEKAESILRRHVESMKDRGEDEAATGTGDFADAAPCDCPGCTAYRAAVKLFEGDDHAED